MTQDSLDYEVFSFYKFVTLADPEGFKERHYDFCRSIGVKARIIVAGEGINGVVAGRKESTQRYRAYLTDIPEFSDIHFKIHETDHLYLRKVQVKHKSEIVNSGIENPEDISPLIDAGTHVDPKTFKNLKDRDDVIILDVRSNYETEVGKFKNAYTLDIDNFREFPDQLEKLKPFQNKKILTYCTGGIKCEKATALLKAKGFNEPMQLSGGILQYAKEEGGEDFEGKCYVFDERLVIDVNEVNPTTISQCIHCNRYAARIINCANPDCNAQVIICEDCGWEWDGACSEKCLHNPRKRPYDGSGYYPKDKMLNIGYSGQ